MLDTRRKEDICREIGRLASNYTPEWNFTLEDSDIGSVLACIYAGQIEQVIREYNSLPERYEKELAQMLGVVPRKPKPARAILVLDAKSPMEEGSKVPLGSQFYAQTEEQDTPVMFESTHEMYVTDARIAAAFAISERDQAVVPLYDKEEGLKYPFTLFGQAPKIPYKNEFQIRHPYIFRGELTEFGIDFTSEQVAGQFMDKEKYAFYFLTEKSKVPIRRMDREGKRIWIHQGGDCEYLAIERKDGRTEELSVPKIRLFAGSQAGKPRYLHDGKKEIAGDKAVILGEELSVYNECHIGFDEGLVKPGVEIALEFGLGFQVREVTGSLPKEVELKLIKRRPNPADIQKIADVTAQEVSFSYYNGRGYCRLPMKREEPGIFSNSEDTGRKTLEFVCPKDWKEMELEGFRGYLIRIQIVKADYCYYQPARHHYPVLHNMRIRYSHRGEAVMPSQILRLQGRQETDLTEYLWTEKPIPAFAKFPYHGESLLIGFDKKPANGPISLYIIIQKNSNYEGYPVSFEYSSHSGFHPLKVQNDMEDLRHSGLILFMPPENMALLDIEGEKRYWIRMTARGTKQAHKSIPVVEGIYMNGVEVRNIDRGSQKEYFAEELAANLKFPAPAKELLEVGIWSKEQGQKVKWLETPSFDLPQAKGRVYVLDRRNQEVVFGDGKRAQIPWNADGPAFVMEIAGCDGESGNVPAESISSAAFALKNVERIYNPRKASGGSSLEGQENMKARGRMLMATGERLVCGQDYVKAARAYSSTIANAWCRIEGKKIMVAVLMEDYAAGSYSFRQIQNPLASYLLKMSSVCVEQRELMVQEPVFVKISVELWLSTEEWRRTLEIIARVTEELYSLFEPVRRGRHMEPKAGYVPDVSQILMAVRAACAGAKIVWHSVLAEYEDEGGSHAIELESLKRSPFMVCINGTHEVHI